MIFDDFEDQTLDEHSLLDETYLFSSCVGSVIYGRGVIRNHSDMIIILALSR